MTVAYVEITLDTTPPGLVITVPPRVDPPATISALVEASEEMGDSYYFFLDSNGDSWPLGATRIDLRTDSVLLPPMVFSTGAGLFQAIVRDEACNLATQSVPVYIGRVVPFEITTGCHGAFDLRTSAGVAMEIETGVGGSFRVQPLQDAIYEVITDMVPALITETGAEDG